MLVKVENGVVAGYPYTVQQLRREHPTTSFPVPFPKELLELYGLFSVDELSAPDVDRTVHELRRKEKPHWSEGRWVLDWDVHQKPLEEASAAIRALRDDKLRQTDWTANSDVVMSEGMRTYRQALRDVPQQEGFPYSVVWPNVPA
jgi:hypothetical protein